MDNGNIQVIILTNMSVQILGKSYDINIEELYLGNKKISELPESIGEFVNLKKLNLEQN